MGPRACKGHYYYLLPSIRETAGRDSTILDSYSKIGEGASVRPKWLSDEQQFQRQLIREQAKEQKREQKAADGKLKPRKAPKSTYGLLPGDYEFLLLAQDGKCAICLDCTRDLVIDHDHLTGRVRGLVCGPCNSALGFAHDSPVVLRAAADYLERRPPQAIGR